DIEMHLAVATARLQRGARLPLRGASVTMEGAHFVSGMDSGLHFILRSAAFPRLCAGRVAGCGAWALRAGTYCKRPGSMPDDVRDAQIGGESPDVPRFSAVIETSTEPPCTAAMLH